MDAIWLGKYWALFLGEKLNPIPLCLGTMSHEQKRKRGQSILRQFLSHKD